MIRAQASKNSPRLSLVPILVWCLLVSSSQALALFVDQCVLELGLWSGPKSFLFLKFSVPRSKIPAGLSEEDIARQIFQYHAGLVPKPEQISNIGSVGAVASALIGPPEGRPSYVGVSETNLRSIEKSVSQYMGAKLPIEGVTFWGGAKQYGTGNKMGVDAIDKWTVKNNDIGL
jgi:hypothetical protein